MPIASKVDAKLLVEPETVVFDGWVYFVDIDVQKLPSSTKEEAQQYSRILARKWLSTSERKLYWAELTGSALVLYKERLDPVDEENVEDQLAALEAEAKLFKMPLTRARSATAQFSTHFAKAVRNATAATAAEALQGVQKHDPNVLVRIPLLGCSVFDGDDVVSDEASASEPDEEDGYEEETHLILIDSGVMDEDLHNNSSSLVEEGGEQVSTSRYFWLSAEDTVEKDMWIDRLNQVFKEQHQLKQASLQHNNGSVSSHEEWEIDFEQVQIDKKIGSGAFGDVFKARLWGTPVAIKVLKNLNATSTASGVQVSPQHQINNNNNNNNVEGLDVTAQDALEDLKNEIAILSTLRHPNNVLYIGACTQPPHVCIITEWCARGSLYDVLRDPDLSLDMKTIVKIAMGIAQGMNYLHNLKQKIIHRDLKAENILLAEDFTVKVADFGLSGALKRKPLEAEDATITLEDVDPHATGNEHKMHGMYGTPGYIAPEVLSNKHYTEKVDVYSFGLLLLELFIREVAFDRKIYVTDEELLEHMRTGGLPDMPSFIPPVMITLITRCLSMNPEDRPSFGQVIATLRIWESMNARSLWLNCDLPRLTFMLQEGSVQQQHWAAMELSTQALATSYSEQHVLLLTRLLNSKNFGVSGLSCTALQHILTIHQEDAAQIAEIIVNNGGITTLLRLMRNLEGGDGLPVLGRTNTLPHALKKDTVKKLRKPSLLNRRRSSTIQRRVTPGKVRRRRSVIVRTNTSEVARIAGIANKLVLHILVTWPRTQAFPASHTALEKTQLSDVLEKEKRRLKRVSNQLELKAQHHDAVIALLQGQSQKEEAEVDTVAQQERKKHKRVRSDLATNLCTAVTYKGRFMKQNVYRCITCNLNNNGKGVCVMCKDTCHAGHEFEMKVLWAMFYCDCNDKQQCKAQSDDSVDARGNSSKKTRHRRNRTPLLPHGFTGKVQMPQVLEEEEEED